MFCTIVGVLEDGRLAKQTAGSFRRVAAGKVAGLQALERNLAAAPIPGLVAFSSVSSIVAPLGQPNYASANASLCAWASAKAAQGTANCNNALTNWSVCDPSFGSHGPAQLHIRQCLVMCLASAKAAQGATD